jgi:hypothetical protein
MNNTKQYIDQQEAIQLQNRIASFMKNFKIGTLLHRNGIKKLRGVSPLTLFSVIFSLPFENVTFSKGIVNNSHLGFGKDAAYDFLNNPRHNWRKFMLALAAIVVRFIDVLTSEEREKVLIFDDSTYDRSRSKAVELLAWIYDHNVGRSLKGFKLLTLGWSDGNSFLPLDFVLCSSTNEEKRLQGITKKLDKRCCGYKRRLEALVKSTSHLESMVRRAIGAGCRADYILMDSWFCFPAILATLGQHLPVICMAKDMKTILYKHKGQWVRLNKLYSLLRKRPGKAKILTSAVVETKQGQKVKIVFVRNPSKKRRWLAIISTDISLANEEIVRIYGKRWDIEVFFKMMKHYLNLERETQLRNYDGIVAHITITMSRYIFLSFEQRSHDDPRTLGSLFFACSDEMEDLGIVEALQRILSLAMEKIRSAGVVAEDIALSLVDSIMNIAIDMLQTGQRLSRNCSAATRL